MKAVVYVGAGHPTASRDGGGEAGVGPGSPCDADNGEWGEILSAYSIEPQTDRTDCAKS